MPFRQGAVNTHCYLHWALDYFAAVFTDDNSATGWKLGKLETLLQRLYKVLQHCLIARETGPGRCSWREGGLDARMFQA